jgi:hypothetical protein
MGKITTISQIVDLFGSPVYLSSSKGVGDRLKALYMNRTLAEVGE